MTKAFHQAAAGGKGEDAPAVSADTNLIHVEGWTLIRLPGEDEPLVLDTDAGERLKLGRPRDIRALIERTFPGEKLNDIHQRDTVSRWPGQVAPQTVREYLLTEAQLLKVIAKSETPTADAILDEVIRVYILVRRGLLAPASSLVVPAGPSLDLGAFREQVNEALAVTLVPFFAELATLRAENAELKSMVSANGVALVQANAKLDTIIESSTSGKVSGEQIARFKSEVARLTDGWIQLRWSKHPTRKSAGGEILAEIYGRTTCTSITQMLASEFGETMVRVAFMQRMVDRAKRALKEVA